MHWSPINANKLTFAKNPHEQRRELFACANNGLRSSRGECVPAFKGGSLMTSDVWPTLQGNQNFKCRNGMRV